MCRAKERKKNKATLGVSEKQAGERFLSVETQSWVLDSDIGQMLRGSSIKGHLCCSLGNNREKDAQGRHAFCSSFSKLTMEEPTSGVPGSH